MASRALEHITSGRQWCSTNPRDSQAVNFPSSERENGDGHLWCTIVQREDEVRRPTAHKGLITNVT